MSSHCACLLYAPQHYLTMLGATVFIPIVLVPAMGGSGVDGANTICCIFFVSGLNTLLQTTIGDRLPIIQGGSFAFLGATFGIIDLVANDPVTSNPRFEETMCTIQGAIIVCALIQLCTPAVVVASTSFMLVRVGPKVACTRNLDACSGAPVRVGPSWESIL